MANKKIYTGIVASVLSLTIISGAAGVTLKAAKTSGLNTSYNSVEDTVTSYSSDKKAVERSMSSTGSVSKDETVYVLAKADGSVNKIIVSDWLKNTVGRKSIIDYTELNDVKNVKGDESFSSESEKIVWSANGNDIYYQGITEKSLPVDVSITYTLDGKEISPEELAGKSGKVVMRFNYTNRQKETVEINGQKETMYVPFVVVTGMILDNESFKNVEVSNGKMLNDGDKSVVMGFALPGVQDSLKIDSDKLELPEYVEVTADVTDFKIETTLTVATNEVFNEIDIDDGADSISELYESMNTLSEAMTQLVDGSSALYDGLSELLSKSGTLIEGVNQLTSGAKTLNDGAATLSAGANELSVGMGELNSGLKELSGNGGTLTAGSKQVFESLLSMANSQLSAAGLTVPTLTIDNYSTVLNGVMSSLDENAVRNTAYNTALEKVKAAVEQQEVTIRMQVEAAFRKQVLEGVLASVGQPMTAEQYDQACADGIISSEMQAQINAAVSEQMAGDTVKSQIDSTVSAKKDEIVQQQMTSDSVQSQINSAVEAAKTGQTSVNSLKKQLDSYNEFYVGLQKYVDGVNSAYIGSSKLSSGSAELAGGGQQLSSGSKSLYDGLSSLKSGTGVLKSGVSQLTNGAMQLSNGIKQFDEEGIQKITEVFEGDIKNILERLKAVSDISREYNSFAGISDNMDGSVKFIYRTDSIEAEKQTADEKSLSD